MQFIVGSPERPECQACGLFRHCQHPFIPPRVTTPEYEVHLAGVGEGPGKTEDANGRYWIGRAGQLLDRLVSESPWAEANIGLLNCVQCWPGPGPNGKGDAKPTTDQMRACRPLLLENLKRMAPDVVVALGQWGIRALLDDGTATLTGKRPTRARRLEIPGLEPKPALVTATYHPAAAFNFQPNVPGLIKQDLAWAHQTWKETNTQIPAYREIRPADLDQPFLLGPTAFDVEYDGEPGGTAIYSIAWANEHGTFAAAIDHSEGEPAGMMVWREALHRWLRRCKLIIGHNVAADLLALSRAGIVLPEYREVEDTLSAARTVWHNDPDRDLEVLATSKLGLPDYVEEIRPYKRKYSSQFGAEAPKPTLLRYNVGDAWATWRLRDHLVPQVPAPLWRDMMQERWHLLLATKNGQHVDAGLANALLARLEARAARWQAYLARFTGIPDFNYRSDRDKAWPFTCLKWQPINLGASGEPALDEEVLLFQKRKGRKRSRRFARALLKLKKAQNAANRLRSDILGRRDAAGLIHAGFSVPGTRTLRASSSRPNFQNLSKELRGPVVSRWPGGWLAHADCSGLEPRVIADRTNCKFLIDIFKDPRTSRKVYLIAGEPILGRPITKGTPDYDIAKKTILATNYNAVPRTLQRGLKEVGIFATVEECQTYIDRYFKAAPELREYIWEQRHRLIRDQAITCLDGWRNELPHDGPDSKGFKHEWNRAVNLEIQHLAAIIARMWTVWVQARLFQLGLTRQDVVGRPIWTSLLGPVHDSLTHDCRDRSLAEMVTGVYVDGILAIQREPMVQMIGRRLRVPLEVDTAVVKSWDAAK